MASITSRQFIGLLHCCIGQRMDGNMGDVGDELLFATLEVAFVIVVAGSVTFRSARVRNVRIKVTNSCRGINCAPIVCLYGISIPKSQI